MFVPLQAKSKGGRLAQLPPIEGAFNVESRLIQPTQVIAAVPPHMVVLAEELLPSTSIDYRRILNRVEIGPKGHHQDSQTTLAKDASQLAHRSSIVWHVFEHVVAHHDIKRTCLEWQGANIGTDVGKRRCDIDADVSPPAGTST